MIESAATTRRPTRFEFYRSEHGYGWSVMLHVRGKHRACWHSTKGTTRMWPRVSRGGDENCNRAVTVVLWPLGHLDVWWEPRWRTAADGMCEECRAFCEEAGVVVTERGNDV